MFGKILYISDSMAYVQNLAGSNVQADLMNMHVIFESNGERILGEITEVNSSEIKIRFLGEYQGNRFLNGVMFGTLNKVLYKNWYTNEKNLTITFDTLYGSYKYKIFSIYIIPTTTDYLTTNFDSNEEKLNFIKLIKDRSIYDFNVNLDENTKILTLSTCQSDTSRLVVHAYLVN